MSNTTSSAALRSLVIIGVGVALSVVIWLGSSKPASAPLVVSDFKLVDANGNIRSSWEIRNDEVWLSMFDTAGKRRISMTVKDNPQIQVLNSAENLALVVSQDPGSGMHVAMLDQLGKRRLNCFATRAPLGHRSLMQRASSDSNQSSSRKRDS